MLQVWKKVKLSLIFGKYDSFQLWYSRNQPGRYTGKMVKQNDGGNI